MIPFPCNTCIHFSGMGFIPYCKKKIVGQVNNKPVYEWCSVMRTFNGECGVDSKLYEKNDNVIRIGPTVIYSGRNNISNKGNETDFDKNKGKIETSETKKSVEPILAHGDKQSSNISKQSKRHQTKPKSIQMEQLATVLATTSQ